MEEGKRCFACVCLLRGVTKERIAKARTSVEQKNRHGEKAEMAACFSYLESFFKASGGVLSKDVRWTMRIAVGLHKLSCDTAISVAKNDFLMKLKGIIEIIEQKEACRDVSGVSAA
ncbi:hypothetical protein [Desulfoluna butyratoxydans]|uniref:hypothetical protein n=1 Tax=Desulfoluna butyratoxydans TaxID=231438 RepID=UPI0015D28C3B|nr:hypothetical protein [Desulfoluna butyratoxydans]